MGKREDKVSEEEGIPGKRRESGAGRIQSIIEMNAHQTEKSEVEQ